MRRIYAVDEMRRLLLPTLILLMALLPTTAQAQTHPFFGVNAWGTLNSDDFKQLSTTPFNMYRFQVNYGDIATAPRTYNWGSTDAIMSAAAATNTTVMVVLSGTPSWLNSTAQPKQPNEIADFADFAGAFTRRYGANGTFWEGNTNAPIAYEVWNEPNFPTFWDGPTSPKEYSKLFTQTAQAIHAADGAAQVLIGGVAFSQYNTINPDVFIRSLLQLGISGFDGVSVHAYADAQETLFNLRKIYAVIGATGRRDAGLWITENGYSDAGGPNELATNSADQAKRVVDLGKMFIANKDALNIQGSLWFAYKDVPDIGNVVNLWKLSFGLRRVDGSPKPAWDAYSQMAAGVTADDNSTATANPATIQTLQTTKTSLIGLDGQTDIRPRKGGNPKGCKVTKKPVTVTVTNKYRQTKKHIKTAIAAGQPSVLHLARDLTNVHSRHAIGKVKSKKGYALSQYPPALSLEGGNAAALQPVKKKEDTAVNTAVLQQLGRYCNGQSFRYKK